MVQVAVKLEFFPYQFSEGRVYAHDCGNIVQNVLYTECY